jgi:hypothetical protein
MLSYTICECKPPPELQEYMMVQKALRRQLLFHLEAASSYAEQLEWSRGREMIDNLKRAIERSYEDQSARPSKEQ